MPLRRQISGQLLDHANAAVTKRLEGALCGKYAILASDGWKDQSRDAVNLSISGKVTSDSDSIYKSLDLPSIGLRWQRNTSLTSFWPLHTRRMVHRCAKPLKG